MSFFDRAQTVYLVLVAAVAVGVGVLAFGLIEVNGRTNDIARDNAALIAQNTKVLCAQKTFYTQQVANTEEFLATPQGRKDFPIEGISRETLVRSLRLQTELRDSYADLSC
jgi:hypothetical protein